MKRFLFFVVALTAALVVAGCAAPRQIAKSANGQTVVYAGYVPVVVVNPSPGLIRHFFLFEGQEQVKLIPDARTGGWMFNRPPAAEFKVEPAYGFNWHRELWLKMPRNSTFTIYEQAERFWGSPVGQPNVVSFTTGSSPVATSYYRQSPTGGIFNAGAVVNLPFVDPTGPSQLRIEYFWNPGAVIKEGLYGVINGLSR